MKWNFRWVATIVFIAIVLVIATISVRQFIIARQESSNPAPLNNAPLNNSQINTEVFTWKSNRYKLTPNDSNKRKIVDQNQHYTVFKSSGDDSKQEIIVTFAFGITFKGSIINYSENDAISDVLKRTADITKINKFPNKNEKIKTTIPLGGVQIAQEMTVELETKCEKTKENEYIISLTEIRNKNNGEIGKHTWRYVADSMQTNELENSGDITPQSISAK